MSEAEAQKIIVGCAIVCAGVVGWYGLKHGGKATPNLKTLTAGAVLTAALLIGAGIFPQVAGPFAILVTIGVVVSRTGG